MVVLGKEYKFYLSVKAAETISLACPGEDLSRIKEVFETPYAKQNRFISMMAVEMNKAYEDLEHFKNPEYKQDYLTLDILGLMKPADHAELQSELIKAFNDGQTRTVEDEPLPAKKELGEAKA